MHVLHYDGERQGKKSFPGQPFTSILCAKKNSIYELEEKIKRGVNS